MRLAKLRPFDEFAGRSARFKLPDPGRQDRWSNRVTQNLLYYQSNYFLAGLILFFLFALADPVGIAWGAGVTACLALAAFALLPAQRRREARRLCEQRPVVACAVALVCSVAAFYSLHAALSFLLAVLVPLLLCLGHASLRLRNVSSKVTNRLRGLRSTVEETATPMEYLLAWMTIGVDTEGLDL